MRKTITWDDVDSIAEELAAAYSEMEPLSISFPRLHQMIIGLDGFDDTPDNVTEHRLEEIQMLWYDRVYD